ncbi:MAG: hypothetical protein U1E36_09470 [Rickettsiales bacterium]
MKKIICLALILSYTFPAFAWEDMSLRSAAPVKILKVTEPVGAVERKANTGPELQNLFLDAKSNTYNIVSKKEKMDARLIEANATTR